MATYKIETNEDQDEIIEYVVRASNSKMSPDLAIGPQDVVNTWIEVMANNYRDDAINDRRNRIIEAYESLDKEQRLNVNSRLGLTTDKLTEVVETATKSSQGK